MKHRFLLITSLMMLFAATASAHPFGPGRGPERGMGSAPFLRLAGMLRHVAEELGITEAQRDEIRSILEDARDEVAPLRTALRDNRDAIKAAATPESYDPAAVATLAGVHGELTTELVLIGSRVRVDIMNVLTVEQREQLEALKQERRARLGRH